MKLNGSTLTALVLEAPVIKLVRCVEIHDTDGEEIESVVLPTLAYIEDELGKAPSRILLCGLGPLGEALAYKWGRRLGRDGGTAAVALRRAGTGQRRPARLFGVAGMSTLRVPINLASDPFRRDRPMLVASAALAILLTVTLLVLRGVTSLPSAARPR